LKKRKKKGKGLSASQNNHALTRKKDRGQTTGKKRGGTPRRSPNRRRGKEGKVLPVL